MTPLPVIVASMVSDQSGEHISSTAIRSGRITRFGSVYNKLFEQTHTFSHSQLQQLKSAQGPTFSPQVLSQAASTVLVGDMVAQYFLKHHFPFNYAIVDGKTARQPTSYSYPQMIHLTGQNQPGTISAEIAHQLVNLDVDTQSRAIYHINGEEDLLAFIPCLSLPLTSLVLYGQPQNGIVMITLTEAEKLRLAKFIDKSFK
jgi:uncharacterized protein (UPF0218 family)